MIYKLIIKNIISLYKYNKCVMQINLFQNVTDLQTLYFQFWKLYLKSLYC